MDPCERRLLIDRRDRLVNRPVGDEQAVTVGGRLGAEARHVVPQPDALVGVEVTDG